MLTKLFGATANFERGRGGDIVEDGTNFEGRGKGGWGRGWRVFLEAGTNFGGEDWRIF